MKNLATVATLVTGGYGKPMRFRMGSNVAVVPRKIEVLTREVKRGYDTQVHRFEASRVKGYLCGTLDTVVTGGLTVGNDRPIKLPIYILVSGYTGNSWQLLGAANAA